MTEFVRKLRLAWHIFFPEQQASLSSKEEGKNRLRMILVADRSVGCVGKASSSRACRCNVKDERPLHQLQLYKIDRAPDQLDAGKILNWL